jgi:exosortase A
MTREDRNFVLVAVLACLPIAIYWDTISVMVGIWSTDAYRHGYLIPGISLFLLWRDRVRLGSITIKFSWAGAVLLAGLVVLWIVAERTSVQQVEELSVAAMVSAFAIAVLGWDGYRQVWFPLAYLVFAVPIGGSVIPPLMDATATISVATLQMLDVPALREGMRVSLPGGTFEIVEACSGFNYLNAGVALGVLVARIMFRPIWKQVSYVAAVIAVFILVNGVRAFIVMFVGSASKMQLLVGKDHVVFGWVLFLCAMAMMYWVAERYSDRRLEQSRAS